MVKWLNGKMEKKWLNLKNWLNRKMVKWKNWLNGKIS